MNRRLGVIFSYLLIFVEALSTLLFAPFLLSSLGQAEYGVYKLVASITTYLFLLDMGVSTSVIKFMSKYRANGQLEEQRRFLGVSTIYYALIAVLVLLVGMVLYAIFPTAFAKGLSAEETALGQKLLNMTMINAAVTLGTSGYFNTLMAYEKFMLSKCCSIAQIVVRVALDVAALLMGFGSVGVVAVDLGVTVVIRIFMVLYVVRKLHLSPTFKNLHFKFIKEIFSFSSIVFLQLIATQINRMTDQVLLGMLVQNASVIIAVYAVGIQIVNYAQNIGSSMNGVLMPGVVRLVEKGASPETLQAEMIRVGRMLFMILSIIWTVFLVNGKTFIILWMGEASQDGYFVAVILMFINVFVISQSIGSQILWAINKHKTQAILQIFSAVLNIVLTILLIRWNPLLGATLGTFLSLFLGDIVVMAIVFRKDIGIHIGAYYKGLIHRTDVCLLLSLAAGLLSKHFLAENSILHFVINCAIMCVVYGVGMLLFGMNQQEKQLLKSTLDKVFSIFKKRTAN